MSYTVLNIYYYRKVNGYVIIATLGDLSLSYTVLNIYYYRKVNGYVIIATHLEICLFSPSHVPAMAAASSNFQASSAAKILCTDS